MIASPASHRTALRLIGMLCLAVFAGILAAGVVAAQPAAAQKRAARTLTVSVSKPGVVLSGSRVTMRCRAKDQNGKVIAGAKVTFRWSLPEGPRTQTRTTGADGVAAASRVTDCGSAGDYRAKVVVKATWRGQVRQVTRFITIIGGT